MAACSSYYESDEPSVPRCSSARLALAATADAQDGFRKYLFELGDGARVEAVRIPLFDTHYTLCLSSQVGCALRCAFCATGRLGLARNLEAWEIVAQLLEVRADSARPITGAVFMGEGEPFHNYEAVLQAAYVLCDPAGARIDQRRRCACRCPRRGPSTRPRGATPHPWAARSSHR